MRSSFSVEISLDFCFLRERRANGFGLSIFSNRGALGKMVSFVVCFDL